MGHTLMSQHEISQVFGGRVCHFRSHAGRRGQAWAGNLSFILSDLKRELAGVSLNNKRNEPQNGITGSFRLFCADAKEHREGLVGSEGLEPPTSCL